jgi:hypothetical protein
MVSKVATIYDKIAAMEELRVGGSITNLLLGLDYRQAAGIIRS